MEKVNLSQKAFAQNLYFVGRNYVQHIEELKNEHPEEPLIFSKPLSCLVTGNNNIPYPSFTKSLHFEGEMVFSIPPKRNTSGKPEAILVGCGLDFTARDVQSQLKQKGWPWFKAKCFRASAMVSDTMVLIPWEQLSYLTVETWLNGEQKQKGQYTETIFKLPELLHHLSTMIEFSEGDLLFTGTPAGVAPVVPGDSLVVRLLLNELEVTTVKCEVV